MVLIVQDETQKAVNRKKYMEFSKDIFIRARDFYHSHEDMRREHIFVTDEKGKDLFELYFKENRIENVPSGMNVSTYVAPYWDYSLHSENMDFSFISRHELYIFSQAEEYSIFMAGLIQEKFPQKQVAFLDDRALLFLDVQTASDAESYLCAHPEIKEEAVLCLDSSMDIDQAIRYKGKGVSVSLMASVFWASEITSFGEKNPDKTFYLIKPIIGDSGVGKVIDFTIGFYDLALKKAREQGLDIIPVVDTGIIGDENQFNNGNGADVWNMFFKPLSTYSLSEVYESKHVIVSQEGTITVNPYLLALKRNPNVSHLILQYVEFNEKTTAYVEKMYQDIMGSSCGRVLAVVGRGTDFNHPIISSVRQKPLSPADLVEKVRREFKQGEFDTVFLATEDQSVYDAFMESDYSSSIRCVPQERYSLTYEKGETALLAEVYKAQKDTRDGYSETLRYLAILYILSKADALIGSTECGATIFAEGYKKGTYEFVDIYGKERKEA